MSGSLVWGFPIWLAAAAAVILPVLIHLWSRGEGSTVVVASLRWFPERAARRARRFRPSRWWLLAIRCLAVVLVALAMAAPRWRPAGVPMDSVGGEWILVEPEVWERREELGETDPRLAEALASRPVADREIRLLVPDFPRATEDGVAGGAVDDAWAWLEAAALAAPPGGRLRLFTMDRIQALTGRRAGSDREVEWVAIAEPRANRWWTRSARGEAILAVSEATATRFLVGGEAIPEGDVLALDDEPPPAATPMTVGVQATRERAEDARVVRASLERLREAGWPLVEAGETEPEILFRLGGESLGSEPTADSGPRWLFQDGSEGVRSCAGTVRPPGTAPGPFPISRCLEAETRGRILWRAPDGGSLLTEDGAGSTARYRFASRLHPDWSGLGEGAGFALWLAESWRAARLAPPTGERPGSDRRRAAAGEAIPWRRAGESRPAPARPTPLPEQLLWGGAGLVLLLERWLAGRRS